MFVRNICILVVLITSSNFAYSKDGYKDIKFDMTIDEVLDLAKNNNATTYQEELGGGQQVTIKGLYKYDLNVICMPGSNSLLVEYIQVIVFDENYRDKYFVINDSGIDRFEELKKSLNKKYELVSEPDDLSIDKYNNEAMGDSIYFNYISDADPKIIITLELQNYFHENYVASVWYSHPQHTDSYLKTSNDSSDDF